MKTRDSGITPPSVCESDTFVTATRTEDGTLSDTQHSQRSDRSLVMHEKVESIAGSERDEDREGEDRETVHDVMNFTQRSRSVSPVRSRSPSIPPARTAPEEIEFPELLPFVAQNSPFTMGFPTSAKQGAPICFASQPALPEKDNVFVALSSSQAMIDLAQRNSSASESDATWLCRLPPLAFSKQAIRQF